MVPEQNAILVELHGHTDIGIKHINITGMKFVTHLFLADVC
jgi:hypothetical protein